MIRFLIIFLFILLPVYSQDEFTGTIDFNGTFWVRMMGYPDSVPKWIKFTPTSFRSSQFADNLGEYIRSNNQGQIGAFFPVGKKWRVESTRIVDNIYSIKLQIFLIRNPMFEGKNVKPINHQIYEVYKSNMTGKPPMAGNYICIADNYGGGSHYNYIKDTSVGQTEIILYDNPHGAPNMSVNGSFDSYGNWLKGTPIITNWKGVNEPHPTLDKYETDPKYNIYKSQTYHNPEEGRKNDEYIPRPDRLGGGATSSDIYGDLGNIEIVEWCLDLSPLDPVAFNISSYISEVNGKLINKYDLSGFNATVTEKRIPDFDFNLPWNGSNLNFVVSSDGKLQVGDQTENLHSLFGLARSIVLLFVALFAVFYVFKVIMK